MYHNINDLLTGYARAPLHPPEFDYNNPEIQGNGLFYAYRNLKESNAPRFLLNLFCRLPGSYSVKIDYLPNGDPGPERRVTRPDLLRHEALGGLTVHLPESELPVSLSFPYPAIHDPEENLLCTIGLHLDAVTFDYNAPSDIPRPPTEAAYIWERDSWNDKDALETFLEEIEMRFSGRRFAEKEPTDCFYDTLDV